MRPRGALAGAGALTGVGASSTSVAVGEVSMAAAAGVSMAGAVSAAVTTASADFLAADFLEILGINCIWFVTGFRFASGQCGEESPPALDGLRQEKFKLNLLTDWDFLSQIGKGNIAVNEFSVAQKRGSVKFEISCALLVLAGAIT